MERYVATQFYKADSPESRILRESGIAPSEFVLAADAQATIAALQARVRTATQLIIAEIGASGPEDLEEAVGRIVGRLQQRTAERDCARRRVDELEAREVDVVLLREDLEKRTAELERVRGELAEERAMMLLTNEVLIPSLQHRATRQPGGTHEL